MRQHYLDRPTEYGVEPVPDTTRVINPACRQLDGQIGSQNALLSRQLVQFAEIQLPQDLIRAGASPGLQLSKVQTAAGH
jgi:hypothetical protein